jgi:hypothetical protein
MDFVCNILLETKDTLSIFMKSSDKLIDCNFSKFHFCLRGKYGDDAKVFVLSKLQKTQAVFYDNYDLDNWLKVMQEILQNLESEKFYLFFEDHFLQPKPEKFNKLINDIEKTEVDVLNTSFLYSSQWRDGELGLFVNEERDGYTTYKLSANEISFLLADGGDRFLVSLNSIFSKKFFQKKIMRQLKFKPLYSKLLPKLLWRIIPRKYRELLRQLNFMVFNPIGFHVYWYNPGSPFNFEYSLKDLLESEFIYSIPHNEICANLDDDNGAYASCLWKRGQNCDLVPLSDKNVLMYEGERLIFNERPQKLRFVPRRSRVIGANLLRIEVIEGKICMDSEVYYSGENVEFNLTRIGNVNLTGEGKVHIQLWGP